MSIIEAWVEAHWPKAADPPNEPGDVSGWVLAVRGNWDASTFSDLNPNLRDYQGTPNPDFPRMVVRVLNRQGFRRQNGQAVPVSFERSIPVVRACRLPTPNESSVAETLNADGTRTLRLVMSEHVYPGETLRLDCYAGWRTGLPQQLNILVTNNSTLARPKPWGRWSIPQWELIEGSTHTVEMVCVSHTPRHGLNADGTPDDTLHQPVAGVRFRASDGTSIVEAWSTALEQSSRYGDGLWVSRATLDLAALNNGPITIHATVYPWEGEAWSTKDDSTRWNVDHVTQNHGGTNWGWYVHRDPLPEKPLMAILDKGGWMPRFHIVVDPVNGLASPPPQNQWPGLNNVRGTREEAEAVPAANKPGTFNMALDMLMRWTKSIPAANGFNAYTNMSVGGVFCTVWIPQGTTPGGATGSTFSVNSFAYGPVQVRSLPSVPSRTDAAIDFNSTTAITARSHNLFFRRLRIHRSATSGGIFSSDLRYFWAEDVETSGTGTAFRSSLPTQLFGGSNGRPEPGADLINCAWTFGSLNSGQGIIRNARNFSRALLHINSLLTDDRVGFEPQWPGTIILNCRQYNRSGATAVTFGGWPTESDGILRARRIAFVNVLIERRGSGSPPLIQFGEQSNEEALDWIFDAMTTVGARFNFHNNGPTNNISLDKKHTRCYSIGCLFQRRGTKHDSAVPESHPNRTGSWSHMYLVGTFDTYIGDKDDPNALNSNHRHEGRGLNCRHGTLDGLTSDLGFVEDRSAHADNETLRGTGNGDYRLRPTSPAWQLRTAPCNYPADADGTLRGLVMHAGFFAAAPSSGGDGIGPEPGWHAHAASEAALSATFGAANLAPEAARLSQAAAEAWLSVFVALGPAGGRIPVRAGAAGLLAPDPEGGPRRARTVIVRPETRRITAFGD